VVLKVRSFQLFVSAMALTSLDQPQSGPTSADDYSIEQARKLDAVIVSRDLFREYARHYSWNRENGRLHGVEPRITREDAHLKAITYPLR